MILKNTDAGTIKKAAASSGLATLREDGTKKILNGFTSIEEVLRATQEDTLVA